MLQKIPFDQINFFREIHRKKENKSNKQSKIKNLIHKTFQPTETLKIGQITSHTPQSEATKKFNFFGVSLSESIQNSKSFNTNGYPLPFIKIIEFIETNNPQNQKVFKNKDFEAETNFFINQFEKGIIPDFQRIDVIILSNILISFLDKLEDTLIPSEFFFFVETNFSKRNLILLLKSLPDENFHCFKRLMKHLNFQLNHGQENALNLGFTYQMVILQGITYCKKKHNISDEISKILACYIGQYEDLFEGKLEKIVLSGRTRDLKFHFV
jgi:hypothetical protein